ncbi:MAG: hypothetical protein KKG64_05220 [Firmicutes bacterium]|nr:hypothetical protein [Bacillota bacterium]
MKKYDIYEFNGIGYKKLFYHQNWRVSMLNYIEELDINHIAYVESHQFTDEVFVLLEGSCSIFFAEVGNHQIVSFSILNLEPHKVYQVHSGVFHTHILSLDAKVLIIEEENTCEGNSPRIYIGKESRALLIKTYQEKLNGV